jgi:hypothetical protein
MDTDIGIRIVKGDTVAIDRAYKPYIKDFLFKKNEDPDLRIDDCIFDDVLHSPLR